ncbi:MAG: hypothetical protein HYU87_02885 [Chloroflexi bacterium]|nr:hypothetical protein [Chloroflexota bacterium]
MKDVSRGSGRPPVSILLLGQHRVARPLPEPPRTKHVSRVGMPATDPMGIELEEWMSELRVGYTEPGD